MASLGIEDQIVAAIRRIMRAVELQSRWLFEECGLTGPQLTTLREAARLGKTPIGVLARAVHLSQPTVTGILDRLEKRKLVARSRDGQDRRTVNVTVTAAGHKLLARAPSLLQDRFGRELARLRDWEQNMTLASLQRIAEMMEAESLEASPVLVSGPVDASGDAAPAEETPSDKAAGDASPPDTQFTSEEPSEVRSE
jgi:DNA-binding MarR family transcriptional regulator